MRHWGVDFASDLETGSPSCAAEVSPLGLLTGGMRALVEFKTSTLTAFGYRRSGVWGAETAAPRALSIWA